MELWEKFLDLLLDTSFVLVISYFLAGLVKSYLPEVSVAWLKAKGVISQSFRGLLFAVPLPICSCGVLPVYSSLMKRGVPMAAAMTFLVAVPELGFDSVLISLKMMGSHFTYLRFGTAIAVALVVGIVVGLLDAKRGGGAVHTEESSRNVPVQSKKTHSEKLKSALVFAYVEMIDHTAVWIIVGLVIAALISTHLDPALLLHVPRGLDVVIMAIFGVPGYVCATGSTPFIASLVAKGLSPGAAITFLITGPATNITTIAVLKKLHGTRTVVIFLCVLTAAAIFSGWLVNLGTLSFIGSESLHPVQLEEHHHGIHDAIAAYVFIGLSVWSAYRQGIGGFLGQMMPQKPDEQLPVHAHVHDHKNCRH